MAKIIGYKAVEAKMFQNGITVSNRMMTHLVYQENNRFALNCYIGTHGRIRGFFVMLETDIGEFRANVSGIDLRYNKKDQIEICGQIKDRIIFDGIHQLSNCYFLEVDHFGTIHISSIRMMNGVEVWNPSMQ